MKEKKWSWESQLHSYCQIVKITPQQESLPQQEERNYHRP